MVDETRKTSWKYTNKTPAVTSMKSYLWKACYWLPSSRFETSSTFRRGIASTNPIVNLFTMTCLFSFPNQHFPDQVPESLNLSQFSEDTIEHVGSWEYLWNPSCNSNGNITLRLRTEFQSNRCNNWIMSFSFEGLGLRMGPWFFPPIHSHEYIYIYTYACKMYRFQPVISLKRVIANSFLTDEAISWRLSSNCTWKPHSRIYIHQYRLW